MKGSICEACRAIDSEKVLDEEIDEWELYDIILDGDADRLVQASGTDCPLCQLLASTLCSNEDWTWEPQEKDRISRLPRRLKAFSFLRHCPWVPGYVDDAQDCHLLLAQHCGELRESMSDSYYNAEAEDGYIACLPKNRQAGLFFPQMIPETFDYTKAKLWLQSCRNTHTTACSESCETISGLKVIDCETLSIVQIETGALWVALSYVWAHNESESSSDDPQPGTFPRGISKTIHDAIDVTKGLGYRYLWIDRYCINQQDETQKRALIAKMDLIYRGADLTIVAAAGNDEHFGLPGVGTTNRKRQRVVELDSCTIFSTGPDPIFETQRSRWWSRGWTFQEGLLSRRRLIFTEYQSWFECTQSSWMEALGGLEHINNPIQGPWVSKVFGRSLNARLPPSRQDPPLQRGTEDQISFSRLWHFSKIIGQYSTRILTFDSDSLNAFAGVSRYFQDCNPPVAHIFGIPFLTSLMSTNTRERAERYMFYFLAWFHLKDTTPRRRGHFPSWTWAGWSGRVDWMTEFDPSGLEEDPFEQRMRHIQFEVDGHLIPQEDYLTFFDSERCTLPDFEVALCFYAQIVPSSLFSWNTRVETGDHFSTEYFTNEGSQGSNESLPTETNNYSQEEDSDEESHKSSESLPANPNDWSTWTVGNHKLWDRSLPPDCNPPDFMEHLEDGRWDCLLLGGYDGNSGFSRRRFVLVVEWLDECTARRVGSVVLNTRPYDSRDPLEFFDDSEMSWKYVRVI